MNGQMITVQFVVKAIVYNEQYSLSRKMQRHYQVESCECNIVNKSD